MSKLDFVKEELKTLETEGLLITIRTIESPQGAWIITDGKRVLNMCANNYLGFANHPTLRAAAKSAIDEFGVGPAAVRSIAGTMSLHKALESKLAAFKNVEATISFQSGFNSNLATIPAMVGEEDVIFSDELNHASIIDGSRLSRARIVRYAHCDAQSLEDRLKNEREARRKLVITDGVFSMDGDIAPLPDIVNVAEQYDAMLMVDDAHGEGVLGKNGRGIADHFGMHGRVDMEVGTLSKAFGVIGGYVAGRKHVIDYLGQKGRPFLFSSALTPSDVAGCMAAVEILQDSEEPVRKLWENTKYFKDKMRSLGFDLGRSQTPITPVMIGDAKVAKDFSRRLFEQNVFAQSIGFPTVARGKARIRVMISATHTREDLDSAVSVFETVGKEMSII